MKTEKNIRKGFGLAGKIAMFCIGLVSLVLTSCESELEIQQSYPFTVETMPVPKELNRNETAEIRCELKSEGDFDGTVYTIRYFQYDGEGSLKLDNDLEFKPNDRYLLENRKFRLYYTSLCDEAQNFIVVVEDNWGNMTEMEFDFNDAGDEETGTVEDSRDRCYGRFSVSSGRRCPIITVRSLRSVLPLVVLAMTVTSLRAQENVEDSRWETAVRCIKKYEGWHGPEHYPYVAYGHRIRKGEKFPVSLTESEGDSILRKDLKEMCALFRHLGKDSLLLSEISDKNSYPNQNIIPT